jgi:hypothetical protein
MRLLHHVILLALIIQLVPYPTCLAQDSGLIGLTLDRQLPREHIEFAGTLPQAIETFAALTGVRMQVDRSVYDVLPWGDRTTFRATFQHQTFRQALTAICRKLGLEYDLSNQAIELRPLPALRRMGRRCTIEELQALDLLGRVPLQAAELHTSAARLLAAIDARLAGSPLAIQNRAFGPDNPAKVTVARNSTLLQALDEISLQTNATWYPSATSIIVLKKVDQIRMQLATRVTVRFDGKDVSEVLLDLSRRSGIDMEIEPGAIRKIDPPFRTIRLELENASVEQALQSICGFTGLAFAVTDHGARIWYAMPPATQPATESAD